MLLTRAQGADAKAKVLIERYGKEWTLCYEHQLYRVEIKPENIECSSPKILMSVLK